MGKGKKNQIEKLAKDVNRQFTQVDTQMVFKHTKRCLAAPVISKMQMKLHCRIISHRSDWQAFRNLISAGRSCRDISHAMLEVKEVARSPTGSEASA